MRKFHLITVVTFFLLLSAFPTMASAYDLARHVTELKLSNGMRWLIVRRAQAPVFSGVVMVRVGGADEEEGKTGLAHMFEHMAFKGSRRIGTKNWLKEKPILDEIEDIGEALTQELKKEHPDNTRTQDLSAKLGVLEKKADAYRAKNEIWEVLSRNGGADLNAFTSKDLTAFHASMPSDRLELWARTLSDMIFEPTFREFYTERRVVAEERRSGTENNPDGVMSEKILSVSFADGPYHWSTIGFEKDIMGLTIQDARAFHQKNYVPGNMVGVLVGDVNIAYAERILSEAFGVYRKALVPKGPSGPGEELKGAKEKFNFDAEPSYAIAYHKPTLPDPTEYAFDIIETALCEGHSSRLQKRLIYDKKMVDGIFCTVSYPGSRFSNLFLIWIDPLKHHAFSKVLAEISDEMRKLSESPLSEEELGRVKKQVTASHVFALDRNMTLALRLAEFETIFDDWRLMADYPKRIEAVSVEEIKKVAQQFLTDANRVIVERLKK